MLANWITTVAAENRATVAKRRTNFHHLLGSESKETPRQGKPQGGPAPIATAVYTATPTALIVEVGVGVAGTRAARGRSGNSCGSWP